MNPEPPTAFEKYVIPAIEKTINFPRNSTEWMSTGKGFAAIVVFFMAICLIICLKLGS